MIKTYRKSTWLLIVLVPLILGTAIISKIKYGTPKYLFSFILNNPHQNPLYKQSAAVLLLKPQTEKAYVGQILSATLVLDTPDKSVNMVEVKISFPNDKIEVTSVSKTGSLVTLWVEEPIYSNANGTIILSGGLPAPGFQGSGGNILTVNFKTKDSGEAVINIDKAAVLANDGAGTDVLVKTQPTKLILSKAPIEQFGDIDADEKINLTDVSILITNWGIPTNKKTDLNNDGVVNGRDLSILLANWTRK